MRYTSIILVLILFIFSSCEKEGSSHPHLIGSWESTTSDLKLTFKGGNFTARYDNSLFFGNSYGLYSGEYKLDGNNITLIAYQLEWFEQSYMGVPKIMIYNNSIVEHFKFRIKGETLELEYVDPPYLYLVAQKGLFAKRY